MKNIHILPTDKDKLDFPFIAKNCFNNNYTIVDSTFKDNCELVGVNIYITSDEEIKEGVWHLVWLRDKWEVLNYMPSIGYRKECLGKEVCKIILTTDQDLIKDGVQAIDDEFLEWFVKNPSCEEVEVKKWFDYESIPNTTYEIITPKEEPLPKVKIDWSNFPKSTQEKVGYIEPKQKIDMSKYTMGIDPYDEQETVEEDFKIWDDLFGILAWKFKPTKSGDMYLDGEKVYEELKSKFKLKRI